MFKKTVFIGLIALFLASCHDKLEILAPYKESVSVFGLLNQNDTAQYIRVQRVYLGEGNALVMAQNPDSIYFKPNAIRVSLQRFKNGNQVSVDNPASANMEIVLSETYNQTDPGIFDRNQLLYKTNHTLYDDSYYRLAIHSNKSGKDFSSRDSVGLIGDFKPHLTYGQQGSVLVSNQSSTQITSINLVPSFNGVVVCKFGSPLNASVCGLTMRLYYTETPNGGFATQKYTDIELGYQYLTSTIGGEEVDLTFSGNGMIQNIANAIPVDASIHHRTADSVHFILSAGGFDISLYNQVNNTGSLSQDKPSYNNIKEGVGVFSSRKSYTIVKKFTTQCLSRLAGDPITCPLRFYDAAGNISTACP